MPDASTTTSRDESDAAKNQGKSQQLSGPMFISVVAATLLIGAGILAGAFFWEGDEEENPLAMTDAEAAIRLNDAQQQLAEGDFQDAELTANEVYYNSDLKDEALVVAGEAATRLQRVQDAMNYYLQVKPDGDAEHVLSAWAVAEILKAGGMISAAEVKYREALDIDPDNLIANRGMAQLLGITGRRWESRKNLFTLLRQGDIKFKELLLLGEIHRPINQIEYLREARRRDPDDIISNVGMARIAHHLSNFDEAEFHANRAISADPSQVEAHIVLGRIYLDKGFPNGFDDWRRKLPDNAIEHPEIWFIIGNHCESIGQPDWAVRCHWEAMRLDPNHNRAAYRLTQLLVQEGRQEEAERFKNRYDDLDAYERGVHQIVREVTPERVRLLANLCERMGRYWEACAWYTMMVNSGDQDPETLRKQASLQAMLNPELPLVAEGYDLARQVSLQEYALPKWTETSESPEQVATSGSERAAPVFVDVGPEVGIEFQYDNGDDMTVRGMQIYNEMGGGIAILDFDLDGWPDIYLSQGSENPFIPEEGQPTDRLFRNLGDGRFLDVTDQAMLGDGLFSQGVAAGDINNDGWPDLFVGNIGTNRIYLNNADGTFREVTLGSGVTGERWTTSVAIGDINGDGWPDLYCCNYAAGRRWLTVRCGEGESARACEPGYFAAEQDRVYFSRGDLTFSDVTESHGFVAEDGRALGVVIGDLENSGSNTIFVANDTTKNFYFAPSFDDPNRFADLAVLKGLASDSDGNPQACMGVAVDDADGDGLIDLFITNFFNESNTLYQQMEGGLFADRTREFNLREPSIGILGFGAQFIDPELDGWSDLFVANGHVDDYTDTGDGYKMRPQFFQNSVDQGFVERMPKELGAYFQGEYLGRSVALLDWNRDGRQDLAVLHLDCPFSLLDNQTPREGSFLHLHLVATGSSRDAIGTKVDIKIGGRTIYKQLVAGSGYQASNERSIFAGLGDYDVVEELIVRWPSGETESWSDVPANGELKIVEGSGELVPLERK